MSRRGSFKFFWRFVNGSELEGVMVAATTSFVSIGWRPADLTTNCRNFPFDAPAPNIKGNPLHAMDCQDIVVAKVKGNLSNVGDYYTRDRSTPRKDVVYGGHDDLTAAVGWEDGGETTVMFRKRIKGVKDLGKQDHEFNGRMNLIWAVGQAGNEFYQDDELKYHSSGRGQRTIEVNGAVRTMPIPKNDITFFTSLSLIFLLKRST